MSISTKRKNAGGRPAKWTSINARQIEKLAAIGCTVSEMADVFCISERTISRRFAGIIGKGRATAKISLRRLQFKAAESGNAAMLIWLGKQMLDQRDTFGFQVETKPKPMRVIGFDLSELDKPKALPEQQPGIGDGATGEGEGQ